MFAGIWQGFSKLGIGKKWKGVPFGVRLNAKQHAVHRFDGTLWQLIWRERKRKRNISGEEGGVEGVVVGWLACVGGWVGGRVCGWVCGRAGGLAGGWVVEHAEAF